MTDENNGYPRVLDRGGCIYGQHLAGEIMTMKETTEKMEAKIDRLRQSAWGVAISLTVASLMLLLNLLVK